MLKETDKKVWLSIIMKDGDHLLDGTSFEDLFRILNKFKIDPAIASSVFVTTITDVIGFLTFLGLGTYFFYG